MGGHGRERGGSRIAGLAHVEPLSEACYYGAPWLQSIFK